MDPGAFINKMGGRVKVSDLARKFEWTEAQAIREAKDNGGYKISGGWIIAIDQKL